MEYLHMLERSEKERNEVLLSLDLDKIKVYCIKFGLFIPDNDSAFLESVHKAILQVKDASREERERSARWLKENGVSPEYSLAS